MFDISINYDEISKLAELFMSPEQAKRLATEEEMNRLGRAVTYLMKERLRKHRYTGALEDSVKHKYDPQRIAVEIGPTAKRGKWDAGLILERGTRPIPNVPWGPIRDWAEFRGIPAGPVWYKIKTRGVSAHPWLMDVKRDPTVTAVINDTAKRLGMKLISYTLQEFPIGGGSVMTIIDNSAFVTTFKGG